MNRFNPTNLIYLFFLKYPLYKIKSTVPNKYVLESQAFMFQYYLHEFTNYNWERLFYIYRDHAEDFDFSIQISNLLHHNLINSSGEITPLGEKYLKEQIHKQNKFSENLFKFKEENQDILFLEGTSIDVNNFISEDEFIPYCLPFQKR